MDIVLRTIAIFLEVILLAAIAYSVLQGVRLIISDLGVGSRYNKVLTMFLIVVGIMVVIFFIAHLTSFYPTI